MGDGVGGGGLEVRPKSPADEMIEAGLGLGLKVWTVVATSRRELLFLCFLLLLDTLCRNMACVAAFRKAYRILNQLLK